MIGQNKGFGSFDPGLGRLFLAMSLMMGVLVAYNFIFPPPSPPQPSVQEPLAPPRAPSTPPTPAVAPHFHTPAPAEDIPITTHTFSGHIQTSHFKTSLPIRDGYKATFTNVGGQLQDYQLTAYQTPISLLTTPMQSPPALSWFALSARDKTLSLEPLARYKVQLQSEKEIVFERLLPQGIRITKKFEFLPHQFGPKLTFHIKNESPIPQVIALDMWMAQPLEDKTNAQRGVICRLGEKKTHFPFKDLKETIQKQAQTASSSGSYVGFDDQYFLAAIMPSKPDLIQGCRVTRHEQSALLAIEIAPFELAPEQTHAIAFDSFLGPKQFDLLQQIGPGLEENVNFGWFGFLSEPLLWLLRWLYAWVHNFGLAIILLTLLIKLLTFPLTRRSYVSMQEMKKIAPTIKELQKKYAHDQVQMNQRQMELYKEKGIHPLAGCLPLVLQMPIWFALYQMLWSSIELYQQPFYGWIQDLTQPDPYYILPVLMGLSMLAQISLQPPADDQPHMKYVSWGMPLFLTFFMLNLPSGLSLYMLANNIITIIQQLYIKRRYAYLPN